MTNFITIIKKNKKILVKNNRTKIVKYNQYNKQKIKAQKL